jgi:hypothetical protein
MSDSLILFAPDSFLIGQETGTASFQDGLERVHRPARLFVAGDYPDKGCRVTESDLDGIVARFYAGGGTVPVKAEHMDSPLDPFGEVVGLYRRGAELFGMLCFSPGVHEHIEARGACNLSVALTREADAEGGGFRLTEASLVFRGRVPGAGFLSPDQVAAKLSEFKAQGKVTPAMEPHARRLLLAPCGATFSDGSPVDIAGETLALLQALPVVQSRGGRAVPTVFAAPGTPGISEATRAMAHRLGVEPGRVQAHLFPATPAAPTKGA